MNSSSPIQLTEDEASTDHPHFNQTEHLPACDHCAYFKGIVYRVILRRSRNDHAARDGPRSLQSVARAEEVIEKREHAKYMQWSTARVRKTKAADIERFKISKKAQKAGEKEGKGETLRNWLQSSNKGDLLRFILNFKAGQKEIISESLEHRDAEHLRKYLLNYDSAKGTWREAEHWKPRLDR